MRNRRAQKHRGRERAALRRRRLFERQKGLCCLCGKPMTLDRGFTRHGGPEFATYEHVVPKWAGGGGGGNLRLSHKACNQRRGGSPHQPSFQLSGNAT